MIKRDELAKLILVLAIALGGWLRFMPTILAGFPVNDGGMFAAMIDDLANSHYLLPQYTSYNHLNIPFAYPPLGFYVARFISDLFGWTSIDALRWIPALISTFSILAFYGLARQLTPTRFHASIAALIFAFMPRAMSWIILGGGVTRAFGQLFMLLTFGSAIQLYRHPQQRYILSTGLFGALAVLSHPEWAVHTAVGAILIWLFLGRSRQTFVHSLLVAGLVLFLTAPWWGTVLARHGIQPFLSAFATSQKWLAIIHLVFFYFTEEPYLAIMAVLGLIGIAYQLSRREFFLVVWMAAPFFLEGRSAMLPAAIPLSILAATGLVDVVLARLRTDTGGDPSAPRLATRFDQLIVAYLLFYFIFSGYQFDLKTSSTVVSSSHREAMTWIRQNTPIDARFLVLTGSVTIVCDPVPEWFPTLTGRTSILTVQGQEWTLGGKIQPLINQTLDLQACLAHDADCLTQKSTGLNYTYLYVTKKLNIDNCEPIAINTSFDHFLTTLQQQGQFKQIYENDEVAVFLHKQ